MIIHGYNIMPEVLITDLYRLQYWIVYSYAGRQWSLQVAADTPVYPVLFVV